MKLSIIVPVYNVENFLNDCVSSFFIQGLSPDDFEVLLIDDGSIDSSLSLANQWSQKYNNIRVFHQANQGQAVARNYGIENARGKYLMFVDSDDYLLPQKLYGLLNIIDKHKLDALIYNIKAQSQDGGTILLKIPNVKYDVIYEGEEIVLKYFVFGSMCRGIYARHIFSDNNLRFKSGFTHEDSELCFRIYPLLRQVMFIDSEVYYYRYNIQSTDRSKTPQKIKQNIESNAILASELTKEINNNKFPFAVKRRYSRIVNSIMTTLFLRVRNNQIWRIDEFDNKMKWLEELNVYPVKGMTCSWKSFLLSKIFNQKLLLKQFLYR